MDEIKLYIENETDALEAVILGIAEKNGNTPRIEEAYDPKSREHIRNNTYPLEDDMVQETEALKSVLEKHNVEVFRPEIIDNCNQIFSRDIAFVIGDFFFKSNILPRREKELEAIEPIIKRIGSGKVIVPPEEVHVEGGDVMLHNEFLFVGTYCGNDYPDYITARTNPQAVDFLNDFFPRKTVKAFDLVKSNTDARNNALHLDCCFQPVGNNLAIIHREGFRNQKDVDFLIELFGVKNIFFIDKDEMYNMWSNIFSISPKVVVSECNFTRLNTWLRSKDITVEEIPYAEIAKQEGLLRCSTLPLRRKS